MKSLHIFTPAVFHDVIHEQLFSCKVVPPPDTCQSGHEIFVIKKQIQNNATALLFLRQNVPKMVTESGKTCHINTYFLVFHPFELRLIQSYPLLGEARTCHQKVVLSLMNVSGEKKLKNTIIKKLNRLMKMKWQKKLTMICVWSLLAKGPGGFGFLCFQNLPCQYCLTCETKDVDGWKDADMSD